MLYNVIMKTLKAFRLSDKAIKILDEQRHATEFLEDLILGYAEKKMEVVPLYQLQALLEEFNISKPVSVTPVSNELFMPKAPDPITGYPCCELPNPCKHWQWDGVQGVYKNTLTGKIREVV